MRPDIELGPHQLRLVHALEQVERGEINRLIVHMPPQWGKSTIISHLYPLWRMGLDPTIRITQSGYGNDLTIEHSREARDLFISQEMHDIFPHVHHKPGRAGQEKVKIERQAAHIWGTQQGGRYYAASKNSTITGRPSQLALIDDLTKDRAEADSPTQREKDWRWFWSSLYTRLGPGSPIVFVETPWHPDCVTGRLIKRDKELRTHEWTVIKIPAIWEDEKGNEHSAWPERWPLEMLQHTRTWMIPREWSSLFMMRPTLAEGAILKRVWWKGQNRYDWHDRALINQCVSRAISFDTAFKVGMENDYTAWTVGELQPDYLCNIREMGRVKVEFTDLMALVIRLAKQYNVDEKLDRILIEDAASGQSLVQVLMRQAPDWIRGRNRMGEPMILPVPVDKGKTQRLHEASTWCYNGLIRLPNPCLEVPWLYDAEEELFAVPGAENDDQADSFSQLLWYWTNHFETALGISGMRIA